MIRYKNVDYQDDCIYNVSVAEDIAPISETLSASSIAFALYSETDLSRYDYGEAVSVYTPNGSLLAAGYVTSVRRTSRNVYEFEATSLPGLLLGVIHRGGVYDGDTLGSIIDDIMYAAGIGSDKYQTDQDVSDTAVRGWLPYAPCRENLQQVLFSCGASAYLDGGMIQIRYNSDPDVKTVGSDSIYFGSYSVRHDSNASRAVVYEHRYIQSSAIAAKELYNASGANRYEVVFQEPCFGLVGDGLIIHESGANYAIVSGSGTLTGIPYLHTTRQVTRDINTDGGKKDVIVDNATLISSLNVENTLDRVADYYGGASEAACSIVLDGQRLGDMLSYIDPVTGRETTGILKSIESILSSKIKAAIKIATGWMPGHFGNSINGFVAITQDATYHIPQSVRRITLVLIGGGDGGEGGYPGTNGSRSANGKGGRNGEKGAGGKILTQVVTVSGGEDVSIVVGVGGEGGQPALQGSHGTATTATISGTTYSSDDGSSDDNGYLNSVTGDVYATPGDDGVSGGDGNPGGTNVVYNGVTYKPGDQGASQTRNGVTAYGGYGGGPAVGANGARGQAGSVRTGGYQEDGGGGDGASPSIFPADSDVIAGGGSGGHGGGGGGKSQNYDFAKTGKGAPGCAGSKGGNGIALIFF